MGRRQNVVGGIVRQKTRNCQYESKKKIRRKQKADGRIVRKENEK